MTKIKVIIDCDPGTDDAQAILIALANSDNIEITAITTVFGNAYIEDTTRNALRLLKYCGRTDIPVYRGCASSLLFEHFTSLNHFHGNDGFGDVQLEGIDPIDLNSISQEPASSALCRLAREQPGSITLLAIGPLTNVSVALMLDPKFGSNLKNCVIMGGNYQGKGNVTVAAEFNWFCDPEAAHNVLTSLNIISTLVPLETCMNASFSWKWYDDAVSQPTRAAQLIKNIDGKVVGTLHARKSQRYSAWDQLAMAIIVDPDVIVEAKELYATVELHGRHTRGQMVIDWNKELAKSPNIRVVTRINQERYERIALTAFSAV